MLTAAGASDRGCVRATNQDRILVDTGMNLYVVADGMGGHLHGERAAEVAIQTIHDSLNNPEIPAVSDWPFGYNSALSKQANRLATAIQLANRQVWNDSHVSPEFSGMGTTVAAVWSSGDTATAANTGDSRIYLRRGGSLKQLSTDDTWVQALVRQGITDEAGSRKHPMRHVLTQAVGSKNQLNVHIVELTLQPEDELLLSSDGLHGVISDGQIETILASPEPLESRVQGLIEAARAGGGPDNVSCVLALYAGN